MRRTCCSVLICSKGRLSDRIFELKVGRKRPESQYCAPWYAPGMPAPVVVVGSGVVDAIQAPHLIVVREVSRVAFAAEGSTDALQDGGGGPPYSSASNAKLCPSSWRMISTAATLVDATATDPPDPPYSASFTMINTASRAFDAMPLLLTT